MHGAGPDEPHGNYLDRLMRRGSFEALWPLFARADKPAKEMTESFSALEHLRPYLSKAEPCRVIHVGDGAHARTGALFALKTQAENISVDPLINEPLIEAWRERFGIRRFSWHKARIEAVAERLNALPELPVCVTFVHAHVQVDAVLRHLRWDIAFSLACCVPGHQLTSEHVLVESGMDFGVLSGSREYQVFANRGGRFAAPSSHAALARGSTSCERRICASEGMRPRCGPRDLG
jgi:hypothetical protein